MDLPLDCFSGFSSHYANWTCLSQVNPILRAAVLRLWWILYFIIRMIYRMSLLKGNPSFRVHFSIIKNDLFLNVHITGKLMFSSFIWHHKHDQWITHDRLHTIWSGTDRNPIVQNKWMAATLGSLWFLTCAYCLICLEQMSMCHTKYKLSLLSHAWPFHHDYGVIWKKRNELSNNVYIFENNNS